MENQKSDWKENEEKLFKEEFSKILAKEVSILTEYDKQFLVARRHLLTKDQLEVFGAVIEETLEKNLAAKPASAEPSEE